MKKFLSLVLALVMTMSLVTVSAGAKDFTDNDKITYKEAVDVLSAIGVIDGYSDGSFNPNATLTRGAAAKIICNLILGPTTASALAATTAPFSDVPADSTFAGYITYCAQQGIVSGYSDGTFRPGNTLTGYAFLKMLLGALGYDADAEKYNSANYAIPVAKQAYSAGLVDNLVDEFDGTKAVTREEACLYAFNTLKATMVEYDSKTTVEINGATFNVDGGDADDMENNTSTDGNIKKDQKMQFAEKYFTNLKKANTDSDDMGRPAVEWKWKGNSIGVYVDYSLLLATYTAGVDKGVLYDLIGKSTVEDIEDGDDAYLEVYHNGNPVTDEDDYKVTSTQNKVFVKNSTDDLEATGRGVITEVYMDDEYGKDEDQTMVTIVIANTFLLQATNDYSTGKESLNVEYVDNDSTMPKGMPNSIDQDDFDVSDFVEDDYIIVTYSEKAREIQTVEAATLLEGEVDTYKTKDSVTIDGTKYKYNKICTKNDEEFDVGSNAVLVLDPYGYIIYVDEANSTGSLVYIQEFGSSSSLSAKALASAYFTDGTSDEITVKKVTYKADSGEKTVENKSTIKALGTVEAGWYTYSVNSSDEYTLKSAEVASKYKSNSGITDFEASNYTYGEDETQTQIIKSETVKFLCDGDYTDNVKGDSSTVFMVLDNDDDLDVYTGIKNLPDVYLGYFDDSSTAAQSDDDEPDGKLFVAWAGDGSYADYVFIDASYLEDDEVGIDETSSDDDYVFILTASSKVVKVNGGDNYHEFEALTNGEYDGFKVRENDNTNFEAGVLYTKVKTDSNDYATKGTKVEDDSDHKVGTEQTSKDAAIDYNNGSLEIGGKDYVLSDDAAIYLIVLNTNETDDLLDDDGADYELYLNISGRALESNLNGYDYTYDYYAVMDDDDSDVIDALYVSITKAKETGKTADKDEDTTDADDEAIAAAIKTIGTELDVTVEKGSAAKVKTAVEDALKGKSLGTGVSTSVKVTAYTAATDGSVSPATVVITVTSGEKSDTTTVTVNVTVDSETSTD